MIEACRRVLLNKKLQNVFDIGLLLFLGLYDWLFRWPQLMDFGAPNPYWLRDLIRAEAILQGHFPIVGPDTLPGGFSLGSFFYFLILPPVAIWGVNPETAVVYTLALKTVSLVAIAWWLGREFQSSKALFFLLLAAPTLVMQSYWITNASYIIILMPVLIFVFLKYARSTIENERTNLAVATFTAGLFCSIHLTFLYSFLFLVLIIVQRSSSFRKKIEMFLIAIGALILVMSPFILAFWNSRYGPVFDGPHFHTLGSELGDYFSRIRSRLKNGAIEIDIFNLNRWQIEYLLVYSYLILRVLFFRFFKRSLWLRMFNREVCLIVLIGSLNFIWFVSNNSFRYQNFGLYLGLLVVAIDLALCQKKAIRILAICLFTGYFVQVRHQIFYKPSARPSTVSNKYAEFNIGEVRKVCDFFNQKKISFSSFLRQSFEIMPSLNDFSFWSSGYCFDRLNSEEQDLNQRYLIVHNSLWDSELGRLSQKISLPDELEESIGGQRLNVEFVSENFVILGYQSKTSSLDNFLQLGNLTFMYEVDPGQALAPQFDRFIQQYSFASEAETKISEFRLCDNPVFCSVYVLSQYDGRRLRVLLISRILQAFFRLPPVSAVLRDLKMHIRCDEKEFEYNLASRLGTTSGVGSSLVDPELNFRTPLLLSRELSCRQVEILGFSSAKASVNVNYKVFDKLNVRHQLQNVD